MTHRWPVALWTAWHPVAFVDEVASKPFASKLMDVPIVLFRTDDDSIAILEDRCPHRNVALSAGRVRDGHLMCPYHGWTFAGDGRCVRVPGANASDGASARALPVAIRAGLVWTCLGSEPPPFHELPLEIDNQAYHGFWWKLDPSEGRVLDAIENVLDPIHSYFLHPGLVRKRRNWGHMDVQVTTHAKGIDARYAEPSDAMTWLQRLTEGSRTYSYGRYRAPALVQIAVEDKAGMSVTISVYFSPRDENHTRPFAYFTTRKGKIPAAIKRAFIIAFDTPIFAQDRAMLKQQARNIAAFDKPDYHHGPNDWFGPVIWRMVNGETPTNDQFSYRLTFDE